MNCRNIFPPPPRPSYIHSPPPPSSFSSPSFSSLFPRLSGQTRSRSGNIRTQLRLLPDLDPVAAGSRVFHGLNNLVQALTFSS